MKNWKLENQHESLPMGAFDVIKEYNDAIKKAEASPEAVEMVFQYNDGRPLYRAMRGGFDGNDYVRHRINYGVNDKYDFYDYTVLLESDALDRCKKLIGKEEDISPEELIGIFDKEMRSTKDEANLALLTYNLANDLIIFFEGQEDKAKQLLGEAKTLFQRLAEKEPLVYTQYTVSCIDGMATADRWMGNYDLAEKEYLAALAASIEHMEEGTMNDWRYKDIIYHIILLYEDISDLYSEGKYSSLLWQVQDKPDYDQSLESFRKAVSSQLGKVKAWKK